MKNWFRGFHGLVPVSVRGANPERVLTLCMEQGVSCIRPQPVEDCALRFVIYQKDRAAVEKLSLRCGCVPTFGETRGFPRLRKTLRPRRFALLLLALAVSVVLVSSMFLWEIDVSGNETVSTGRILRALEDIGFSEGKCWLGMKSEVLQSELLLKIPELAWVSFQIRGSRAEVIVTEAIPAPEIRDPEQPVSLVSNADGVIEQMTVLNGQPQVKRGDYVSRGQTLISSTAEDLQGEKRSLHAMGSVRARTYWELTAAAPVEMQKKTPTGERKSRWALQIGKKRLNFYKNSGISDGDCDTIYKIYDLAIPGVFRLPVSLIRETQTESVLSDKSPDADLLAQTLHETLQRRIGPDGEVLESHLTQSEQNGLLTVTLRAECEQEIGAEVPDNIPEIQEEPSTNDRTDH